MTSPATSTPPPHYLTPEVIAREALLSVRAAIGQPLNGDPFARFEPHKQGDTVTIRKPGTTDHVAVVLDWQADVAFAIDGLALTAPLPDFVDQFLTPATQVLAQYITKAIADAGTGAHFASAPLSTVLGAYAAVETLDGIALRALYQYDIATQQFIVCLDVLYGVTPREVAQ